MQCFVLPCQPSYVLRFLFQELDGYNSYHLLICQRLDLRSKDVCAAVSHAVNGLLRCFKLYYFPTFNRTSLTIISSLFVVIVTLPFALFAPGTALVGGMFSLST